MPINRFPRTDFNKINLDWIMRKLKEVKNVTDNIGTAVEDAQQAAAEATTAAAGAAAAAADATQAAEEAVEAIETVTDQAAQAVQTANAAQSTATGASNTAATALSRANTAQSAAQQAQTTASGALAQADLAREETAALNDRFPVSIADGGTGATTAAGALTALGFVAGNGYWKSGDGFQACWGGATITRNAGINNVQVTFPVSFVDNPVVFASYPTGRPELWPSSASGATTTGATLTLYTESGASGTASIYYFAIGRWK